MLWLFVLVSPAAAQAPVEPAPPAEAPAPQDASAPYSTLIAQAVEEFVASHFVESRALFERAHAINPNARTLRGLGITAFELRRYTQAVQELNASLADTRNPLTPELRTEVENALARANEFVGTIALQITPASARVLIEGTEVDAREISLDVGDYTMVVSAMGYRAATVRVTVVGGKKQEVTLRLFATAHELELGERGGVGHTDADPSSPALYERWWFWAGAAAVVGGVITGALLLSNHSNDQVKPGDVGGVVSVLSVAP